MGLAHDDDAAMDDERRWFWRVQRFFKGRKRQGQGQREESSGNGKGGHGHDDVPAYGFFPRPELEQPTACTPMPKVSVKGLHQEVVPVPKSSVRKVFGLWAHATSLHVRPESAALWCMQQDKSQDGCLSSQGQNLQQVQGSGALGSEFPRGQKRQHQCKPEEVGRGAAVALPHLLRLSQCECEDLHWLQGEEAGRCSTSGGQARQASCESCRRLGELAAGKKD